MRRSSTGHRRLASAKARKRRNTATSLQEEDDRYDHACLELARWLEVQGWPAGEEIAMASIRRIELRAIGDRHRLPPGRK